MTAPRAADPPADVRARLRSSIAESELPTYVYSYPSKRAYRLVRPVRTVADVWADAGGRLNLYVHVPFCGYRCTFCTLFLTPSAKPDLVEAYLDSLQRQIATYGELLGHAEVSSLYVGGGTPTRLSPSQFETLFAALHRAFPRFAADAEVSVEGSPDSIDAEILAALRNLGVNRISMGLQTLDPEEQRRTGRPYSQEVLARAVAAIQGSDFENTNYDLIYGLRGQTRQTWFESLHGTLSFAPQTITIYPIVFRTEARIERQLAGDETAFMSNEEKYAVYDETVARLADRGFHQDSFVRFTTLSHDGLRQEEADFSGVPLLGLGPSARSYSPNVHYSTDFAVSRSSTMEIITGYVEHDHHPLEPLGLGFVLDDDEHRRRFITLNLSLGSLDPEAFARRFGAGVLKAFAPELDALEAEGCLARDVGGAYRMTAKGFKYSNVIGEMFKSARVDHLEQTFVPS